MAKGNEYNPDLNYLRLINAFWLLDLEERFSHLVIHLYFKLLDRNNKLGWKRSFKFPNSALESEIGTRSKNLIVARQKLVECGLIDYEKGTTREAGTYTLLSIDPTKESNQESKKGCKGKVIRGTLNKQDINQTKPKKESKKKIFIPPSKNEFIKYFVDNDFSRELGERAFNGYAEAEWHDSHGNKIKNWKQKCQHVWFKTDNKNEKKLGNTKPGSETAKAVEQLLNEIEQTQH